jgi:SAM-dependent methyltransferase
MAENNIQIFAEASQEYDAWFDRHQPVYKSELRALKRFISPGGLGLEIGVGTGRFALPLGIALGVEPAEAMAVLAQRRGIKVFRAVAEALPFRADSFDLAALVTVLCFLPDPYLALAEATRVLKPGGQILLAMIDGDSPLGRSYEAHKQESKFYRQAQFYGVRLVVAWLKKLAFEQLEICQTIFRDSHDITTLEPVKEGHGEGGFAVISARKPG